MSYEFYKIVHLFGIVLLFTALGGLAVLAWRGGGEDEVKPIRKKLAMGHGIAMLIIFVAGFGLMARTGMMGSGWPGWIYGKLGVWLLLGGAFVIIRRQGTRASAWVILLPTIAAIAAYLAIGKPGT